MPNGPLQPGERVVELAAVAQSAAVLSGVVSAVLISWLFKRSWVVLGASFFIGGFVGFVVGMISARSFYRTGEGMTAVVRVGGSSLPKTIRAAWAGTLPTTAVLATSAIFLLSAEPQAVFTISLACGAVIGVAFACCSSLL